MKTIGIIPARLGSTRFPEKILASIHGKPMIQHVWENMKKSKKLDDLILAVDSSKVKAVAERFGAKVVMTDPKLPSGTDRIAAVAKDLKCDLVINIQGDEPMLPASVVDRLIEAMALSPEAEMGTLAVTSISLEESANPNVVKVIISPDDFATAFTRNKVDSPQFYKHIGVYAYRKAALLQYCTWAPTPNEKQHRLEQLRALDHGFKIKVARVSCHNVAVDTPEDLRIVEQLLED